MNTIVDTNTTSYTLFTYAPFFFKFVSYRSDSLFLTSPPPSRHRLCKLPFPLQLSRTPLPVAVLDSIPLCKPVSNHLFSSLSQISLLCKSVLVGHCPPSIDLSPCDLICKTSKGCGGGSEKVVS